MFKNTYPSYFIEQKYTKLNIYIYTYILCNVTKEYIYICKRVQRSRRYNKKKS